MESEEWRVKIELVVRSEKMGGVRLFAFGVWEIGVSFGIRL